MFLKQIVHNLTARSKPRQPYSFAMGHLSGETHNIFHEIAVIFRLSSPRTYQTPKTGKAVATPAYEMFIRDFISF
uniref:Uncharacterized protein n=1 Tax=uncultured alpha proteobacterium EB080_L58F04 TaxID=710798 RepID=E0Y1C8_9PROT|nr:hypothetical protein [uncultured alpha proteobacterium EB080_L58F04]